MPEGNDTGTQVSIFCCCVLSFNSSLYVVYKYWKSVSKSFSSRMIFLICLSSWGWSLNQIVTQIVVWIKPTYNGKPISDVTSLCDVQGYFQIIYFLTTFYWLYCLIREIYQKIVIGEQFLNPTPDDEKKDLRKRLMLIAVFFLISGIPVLTSSYEPAQPLDKQECFLKFVQFNKKETHNSQYISGTIERILFILIPQPLLICYQCFVVFQVRKKLQKVKQEKSLSSKTYIDKSDIDHFNRMLILYPVAMFVCWIPLYVQRFGETVNIEIFVDRTYHPQYMTFCYIMISLEGFFNAFIYGIDLQSVFKNKTQQSKEDWPNIDRGKLQIDINESKSQLLESF